MKNEGNRFVPVSEKCKMSDNPPLIVTNFSLNCTWKALDGAGHVDRVAKWIPVDVPCISSTEKEMDTP